MISRTSADRWREVGYVLLSVLLLWAAVSKLAFPSETLANVFAYEIHLPQSLLKFLAVILPWVELLCGLLILLNREWRSTALLFTAMLLIVFLVAISQAWVRGLSISCGCFDLRLVGLDAKTSSFAKLLESPAAAFVRNVALLGLVLGLGWSVPVGPRLRPDRPDNSSASELDNRQNPAKMPPFQKHQSSKRRARR